MVIHNTTAPHHIPLAEQTDEAVATTVKPVLEHMVEHVPDNLSVQCFEKGIIDPNAWNETQNVLWLHSKGADSIEETGADAQNYKPPVML